MRFLAWLLSAEVRECREIAVKAASRDAAQRETIRKQADVIGQLKRDNQLLFHFVPRQDRKHAYGFVWTAHQIRSRSEVKR